LRGKLGRTREKQLGHSGGSSNGTRLTKKKDSAASTREAGSVGHISLRSEEGTFGGSMRSEGA